jgi:alpha-D-ribose 1-methylphosphonate 5-triphosphate synthase subunit PhnG
MPITCPRLSVRKRREWLAVLARANQSDLEAAVSTLPEIPAYRFVRPPETGSVMLKGRVGGTGRPFHLGEATVTRCTVQLAGGAAGTAYVLGRSVRKAELVALFDAWLQDPASHQRLSETVLEPLRKAHSRRVEEASGKAAATQVHFFTMARGE